MKLCSFAVLLAALVTTMPVVADDEQIEEVVVTGSRLNSPLSVDLNPVMDDAIALHDERVEQNRQTVARACAQAQQEAIAHGAVVAAGTAAGVACGRIPNAAAAAACAMAVTTAVAMCTFDPSGREGK
ncbi:MAG: hypothetical protein OXE40_13130 [Gammaproteobacteria bacterium]|nr:hypothetical protein [Gammaproteobacteria bacterium]